MARYKGHGGKPTRKPTKTNPWPTQKKEIFDESGNKIGVIKEIDWTNVGNR